MQREVEARDREIELLRQQNEKLKQRRPRRGRVEEEVEAACGANVLRDLLDTVIIVM